MITPVMHPFQYVALMNKLQVDEWFRIIQLGMLAKTNDWTIMTN